MLRSPIVVHYNVRRACSGHFPGVCATYARKEIKMHLTVGRLKGCCSGRGSASLGAGLDFVYNRLLDVQGQQIATSIRRSRTCTDRSLKTTSWLSRVRRSNVSLGPLAGGGRGPTRMGHTLSAGHAAFRHTSTEHLKAQDRSITDRVRAGKYLTLRGCATWK